MGTTGFSGRYGAWAVVAGASEGVGLSVARELGVRGIKVVLVSRRQSVLDQVAAGVPSETRTVAVDLSEHDAAERLAGAVADLEVGLLVYNAGADPYTSRFLDQPVEVWQGMVVRNCQNVLATAHHFGGLMARRGRGGIVLVSSGAAWAGGAYLATYGASKAFDVVLAEALWAELGPLGIDVLGMVLGPTDTPAFRRVLKGRELEGLADPDEVAREMLDHLGQGPTSPPGPNPFAALSRREAVELMSQGAAFLGSDHG